MINLLFSWHFYISCSSCLYLQNSWGNLGTQTTELPAGLVSLFWATWHLLWSNWLCWKSRFWSHALSGIIDWLKEVYSILRQGIFSLSRDDQNGSSLWLQFLRTFDEGVHFTFVKNLDFHVFIIWYSISCNLISICFCMFDHIV